MFCPNCGKDTPIGAKFCPNCGRGLGASPSSPSEWEQRDYLLTFREGELWYRNGTETDAKNWFWSERQQKILTDLQSNWLDKGWQQISEIGPNAFKVRWYKRRNRRKLDLVGTVLSFGLEAVFHAADELTDPNYDNYCEPVEFRVKLRRPKSRP